MGANIKDVARRAGVSISTVSRVLNNSARVNPAKRTLVLEAAEALGYAPNPAARSLLSKRTGGLGVLLPFVSGEFFSELLHHLDTTAQEHGYFLLISTSHRLRDEFKTAMRALNKRVDGLIIMAPELDAGETRALAGTQEPVVFLNTHGEALPFDVLNFDNFDGAYQLATHLIDLGHTRLAILRGPSDARDAEQRVAGYLAALVDRGLGAGSAQVIQSEYTQEDGYAATQALLQTGTTPTALCCANDTCAFGAIRALNEAGLTVPSDVSVVGFDGLPSTSYVQPPLTTARVPVDVIGREAVLLLLNRLTHASEGEPPPVRHQLPVELVLRSSTAPPRVSAD